LLCGHIALIRRLHHNFHIDEALSANVGFDSFGDLIQIVLLEHSQASLCHSICNFRRLRGCGPDGHPHARFDFVGGDFRHQDHAHMSAGGIA
jgi:hypothetical protein